MNSSPRGSSVHGDFPGKNIGVGCRALLQGIVPTQGSNPGLMHCGWILYCLSHQGILLFSCCCCCCITSVVSGTLNDLTNFLKLETGVGGGKIVENAMQSNGLTESSCCRLFCNTEAMQRAAEQGAKCLGSQSLLLLFTWRCLSFLTDGNNCTSRQ